MQFWVIISFKQVYLLPSSHHELQILSASTSCQFAYSVYLNEKTERWCEERIVRTEAYIQL